MIGSCQHNFESQLKPGLALQGSVRSRGGPVGQFIVSAQGASHYQAQVRDETGRFKIPGVLPGRYTVGVTSEAGSALRVVD